MKYKNKDCPICKKAITECRDSMVWSGLVLHLSCFVSLKPKGA